MTTWDGYVLRCSETEFTAVLHEQGGSSVEATFDVGAVPEVDREFIAPGAFFRWTINEQGDSLIRFSRSRWTKLDIEKSETDAVVLAAALLHDGVLV